MALALNIVIGFLLLLDLVLIALLGYLYVSLKDCENKESIFCLQWECPGVGEEPNRAVRIYKGEVIESGPYGPIFPESPGEGRQLSPEEVCH